ncbi:spindle poison sensitivity protein Scp3, putative [Metarhizium acridum CQMa 102]|uniref:Spindle poison sensitivity protein Scp3, putative n=1 Tax=Metarhizium acridum (strain CQMa 102) TaxID=655827 RepID=E9ECW5_METAQ|nr:spindle poison sensitivity protein Scp3, putative [Metarhizium acridum CQMa 102]EFY86259.1 spindle poison sensitivity protein Scp3, putative [Metarhizium acridum CQMa 102]
MSLSMSGLAPGLPPPPLLSPSSGSTWTSTRTWTSTSTSTSSPVKRPSYTRHSLPAAAMPEYRHVRSGSLNIPNGAASNTSSSMMPRSPPNTSHVPCKFFRQGACQAGNACPFSHDLGAAAENICKYFAKGNCKFGPKCANIHVLPDGRRINYGKTGVTIGTAPIGLAGRASPNPASPNSGTSTGYHQSSASALTTSLYGAEASPWDDRQVANPAHHPGHQASLDNGIPSIDSPYGHSNYGSPREDDPTRLGFGLSPANGKGLSILDAPLPASFDSNGISNAARFPAAPWPSSVPSKFGLESPTPSLSNAKDSRTSETLKLLHTSAFGSSEHLTPTASSPPNSQSAIGDEYFGKRAMHSSRYAKPRMLSSSMPKASSVDRDWEAEFAFDDDNLPENYVPENLQELLTPAEKARRGSSSMRDEHAIEALKYGSPMGTSPSRWGSLFQRQKEEEDAARAARNVGSAFGHVGSPLRRSTLAQEIGDDYKSPATSGRLSAGRSTSESMSVLSQQLQRSRLDDAISGSSSSPHLHPTTARLPSSSLAPIGKDRAMERHVSSGSISSSVTGRFTTPIDEEDPAFVFSMEEEDDAPTARMRKRISAGLSMGPLGSYASAVAGKNQSNSNSKENRDSVPVNGR